MISAIKKVFYRCVWASYYLYEFLTAKLRIEENHDLAKTISSKRKKDHLFAYFLESFRI